MQRHVERVLDGLKSIGKASMLYELSGAPNQTGHVDYAAACSRVASAFGVSTAIDFMAVAGSTLKPLFIDRDVEGDVAYPGPIQISRGVHINGDIVCSGTVTCSGSFSCSGGLAASALEVRGDASFGRHVSVERDIKCNNLMLYSGRLFANKILASQSIKGEDIVATAIQCDTLSALNVWVDTLRANHADVSMAAIKRQSTVARLHATTLHAYDGTHRYTELRSKQVNLMGPEVNMLWKQRSQAIRFHATTLEQVDRLLTVNEPEAATAAISFS